jgi:hypothetical protein
MKMKYTLIAEDEYGGSKTTREFTEDYLPNVLTEIELFLKGAGFIFNGNLDFVDEFAETNTDFEFEPDWDECYTTDDTMGNLPKNNWPFAGAGSNTETGGAGNNHSQHYFDTERNK